ncbi:MAG: site-specific DNA-methyltransferase [Methanosphaera sp.]|uniref:site-specific DNA-methyltransferase n=1 Tax=Methanosphaera sp. TaxID=2666342 RepID=UPI00262CA2B3|nr:site-specific DNA-methyltransferase [Methanosphaera sp.]MDD6535149.1 site-specific DNA-methyltransferase [Methanosphaera sp.]
MEEIKLTGESKNIVSDNIQKLKEIFPDIFTENKIDFDKLKCNLGEFVDDSKEKYSFTWSGKTQAIRESQKQSTGTLRPCEEESKDWDTTQNLYIEGDNLEVLKLLQKSYNNKIKMIYIDPPYNTGNEFVYMDNYDDNLDNYLKLTSQIKDRNKVSTNTETMGRFHSNWLNMMYPRLKLARNLLSDEGIIFISIDDNEKDNLKKICDEIFGEDNFITTICQKSRGGISNDKIISENHNYQLFYAKNKSIIHETRSEYGVKKTEDDFKRFNKDDNDGKGPYSLNPVSGPGGARKGNPYYNFLGVEGYFRFSEKTMTKLYNEGKVIKKNNNLYQKTYLSDLKDKVKKISTWWDEAGTTSSGTKLIKQLFPEVNDSIFDHPKPIELIELMIEYCNFKENDIVLDFFSGSSTTAHAVIKANSNENKNYIIEESGNEDLDIGFKVFKLDSSNLEKWDPDYNNIQKSLIIDQIKEGRSDKDLIYEIMIKYGIELTYPIEQYGKIYSVGSGELIICLDDNITKEIAYDVINLTKNDSISRVVFKDSGFASDAIKTNIKEILKTNNIDEFITI